MFMHKIYFLELFIFNRKRSVKNNNTFIVSLSLLNIAADFTNLSFILV